MRPLTFFLSFLVCAALAPSAFAQSLASERIREYVEALRDRQTVSVAGGVIASRELLPAFYSARAFEPAWGDPNAVDALIEAVRDSRNDGLDPADYHLELLESLRRRR